MNFSQIIDRWMTEEQQYKLKRRTYLRYYEMINRHIKPQLGSYEMAKITIQDIRDFQSQKFCASNAIRVNTLRIIL